MREVGVEKSRQRIKRGKFGELNYLLLLARAFLELLNRLSVSLSPPRPASVFFLCLCGQRSGDTPRVLDLRARDSSALALYNLLPRGVGGPVSRPLCVVLCYVMLWYVMVCYAMSCYVVLCYVMVCYVMFCYVMLCDVMLCCVMLCYVMLVPYIGA
jgi:hypothetical protein